MSDGRYMYCIINSGTASNFGDIGINDTEVCTVPYQNIAAVVHSCEAKSYATNEIEMAKDWILAHSYVIDNATKKFGTVLPFSFDVIVRGDDDTVKEWLARGYGRLKEELERVKDKAEYSVQIFYEHEKLAEKIVNSDQELGELKKKTEKMPKGTAYLFQKQYEQKVKDAISADISGLAKEFSSRIKAHAEEMKVEENPSQAPEKYRSKKLIVTLSCLVHRDNVEKLGEVLDEINKRADFAVRFTGPWAPFSFVALKEV